MFNNIKTPTIKSGHPLKNSFCNQINFQHENNEIKSLIDTLDISIKQFTLGDKRLFPNAIIGCDERWNGLKMKVTLRFKIGVEATSEYHAQCEFHKYGGIMRLGWIFSAKDKRLIEKNIYASRGCFPNNELRHIEEMDFLFTGRGKHKLTAPKLIKVVSPSLEKVF